MAITTGSKKVRISNGLNNQANYLNFLELLKQKSANNTATKGNTNSIEIKLSYFRESELGLYIYVLKFY